MEKQQATTRARLAAIAKKAERTRDAVQAMTEYDDATEARRANTKKLRMLRLERERKLVGSDSQR